MFEPFLASTEDTEHRDEDYIVFRVKPPRWWRPGGSWGLADLTVYGRRTVIVEGGMQRGSALRLLDLMARRRKACRGLYPAEKHKGTC